MALINFDGISKSYALQVCYSNVTGEITHGDKIALIGRNGGGKTTFIKALIGDELPDEGKIFYAKGIKIAYLSQTPQFETDNTVFTETLTAFDDVKEIEKKLAEIADKLADNSISEDEMNKYLEETANLQAAFEARNGYLVNQRVEQVLMGLGYTKAEFEKPLHVLSGGEQARVELAKLLLQEPDVLILDEPTNHLDIEGIQWLEKYLREKFKGAYLVVSHDRYFLDNVTEKTWELERGKIETFVGNYSKSRELKAERYKERISRYKQQQIKIEKEEEYIRRFMAGVRTNQAKGRLRRLERFKSDEAIDKPIADSKSFRLNLKMRKRLGQQVVEAHDVSMRFGDRVLFEDLNFDIKPGEIFGICGPNGSGKTTMLKLMTEQLEPYSGYFKIGGSVEYEVLQQQSNFQNTDETIYDNLHNFRPSFKDQEIRDILGAFLFGYDDVEKKIEVLSGGEKKRIELIKLLLKEANLLILDEPTNHLDIHSREAIENALYDFPGTIIIISHDRYLLDKLVERILWLDGVDGTSRIFDGNYTQMLETKAKEQKLIADREKEEQKRKTQAHSKNVMEKKKPKKAPVFKGSITELEEMIDSLHQEIASLEAKLAAADTYQNPELFRTYIDDYENTKNELATLETEWVKRLEKQ